MLLSRFTVVVLSVAAVMLSGCYSMSLLQEADTLGPGKVRAATGLSYWSGSKNKSGAVFPEAQLRVGVAPRVELSAKYNLLSISAGAKVSLLDRHPYKLAALTGVQWGTVHDDPPTERGGYDSQWGTNTTLLGAVPLTSHADLMLAPDFHIGKRSKTVWIGAGVRLGVAARVSDNVSIIPECALLKIVRGPDESTSAAFSAGDLRVQCGLGMSFGHAYR